MKNVLLLTALFGLAILPAVNGQTPGTGNNVASELTLETGTSALDGLDKTLGTPAVLTMRVDSDGSLDGAPFILAASFAATGSDPFSDIGVEIGVLGLNLGSILILVNGLNPSTGFLSSYPGGASVAPAGSQFAVTLPLTCDYSTSLYLQGAAPDATKPNGIALTTAIEHAFGPTTTVIPAGDDTATNYPFQCHPGFPYYGVTYNDAWINSNGSVSFTAGNTDFSPTEAEFLSQQPRIAALWKDLNAGLGGSVTVTESPSTLVVAWNGVPNFAAAGNLNSVDASLYPSGDIELSWAQSNALGTTVIAGISPGASLSLTNPIDLRSTSPVAGGANQALYQILTGTPCGNERHRISGGSGTFTYDGISAYTYLGSPAALVADAASVTPASGTISGGTAVTVNGAFFDLLGTYTVEFGAGNFATGVTVTNACAIACVTPTGALGPVDVIVTDTITLVSDTIVGGYTYTPNPILGPGNAICNPGSMDLSTIGDDNSVQLSDPAFAGFSFDFYGVNYTASQMFVNSNGNLTFGTGDTDFSESTGELRTDQPRICLFWDDLSPQNHGVGGGVFAHYDGFGSLEICFVSVPEFSATGSNTGKITLFAFGGSGAIYLDYGTCSLADCIVGVSPGGSLYPLGTGATDLSFGTTITPGAACFQQFTVGVNAFDLSNFRVIFGLDATGTPVVQL